MQLKDARSLLFVPATATAMLEKAVQRGADGIIIDLEDSIPPERKAEARAMAAQAIAALAGQVPLLVRVNSEEACLQADVAALPLSRLQAVMLPKVESLTQVDGLVDLMGMAHAGAGLPPVAALVETPLGVLHADRIAAHPALCALGFGAEDFACEMGVEPVPESLAWAAQKVATCARAHGLACWGLPGSIAEIQDMDAFGELVRLARRLGFTGTVCIHPRQVPMARSGFSPSVEQLAWARRVIAADEDARARGVGAVKLDGRMIDRPIVERARRWVRQAGA
jgi:citrate lyase subunit beta/citryl-CoA lyase